VEIVSYREAVYLYYSMQGEQTNESFWLSTIVYPISTVESRRYDLDRTRFL